MLTYATLQSFPIQCISISSVTAGILKLIALAALILGNHPLPFGGIVGEALSY
jgi:hypothetical protein